MPQNPVMRPLERFGETPSLGPVDRVTITGHGLTACFLTYGATLQALYLEPHPHSLVLSLDGLADYLAQEIYLGATIGRYANRIAAAQAMIGGRLYHFNANCGRHLLHGGADSTARRNWRLAALSENEVSFTDHLPDGHMGFPGALTVRANWRIGPGPVLSLDIRAESDAETLVNFAHHSYFNLDGGATILDHRLRVLADTYLPADADRIPLGEPARVGGTPLDFRRALPVGEALRSTFIDHNFCVAGKIGHLRRFAEMVGPRSGIRLTLESTEAGLQVYDGAATAMVESKDWPAHAGLALEPQNWPDAPNNPLAPSAVITPANPYHQHTRFGFGPQ